MSSYDGIAGGGGMAAVEPCRRCLLSELSDAEYYRSVYEYIAHLPEESKTAPEEYRRRLSLCRACDELVNGMCRLCGCFVEARAAKKERACAQSPARW